MMTYAARTEVSVRETLDDIERLIKRNKGSGVQIATADDKIAVLFANLDRRVRFVVHFGDHASNQSKRSLARALLLAIKSKFVSIESGIETFEEAFLAQTVMPDGRTVIDHTGPRIIEAYQNNGIAPPLLPDYSK
jgi:hypothetical protein